MNKAKRSRLVRFWRSLNFLSNGHMVFFIKIVLGRDMAYSSNRVQNFHHSTPTSNFQEKNRFFSKSALPNISSQLEYVQGHPWPSCVKRKPSVLAIPTWRLAGLTVDGEANELYFSATINLDLGPGAVAFWKVTKFIFINCRSRSEFDQRRDG